MIHDSDDDDDLAADPLAAFKAGPRPSNNPNPPSGSSTPPTAPVTAPAPTTFASTGSGFTSINRPSVAPTPIASASQSRAEDDADPFAFDANNIPVGDGEDEADVVEEARRPASSTPSAHRIQGRGQARPRSTSATRERTKSRQATEDSVHRLGHAHVQDQLVPILPRAASEGDDANIIDMTAGDDVVRRVLAEADGVGGEILYKVELGDYSVEEVRLVFRGDNTPPPHWLCADSRYYPRICHKPMQFLIEEIQWHDGICPFNHIPTVLSLVACHAHFAFHMSGYVLFQAPTTLVCTCKYPFILYHFFHFDR